MTFHFSRAVRIEKQNSPLHRPAATFLPYYLHTEKRDWLIVPKFNRNTPVLFDCQPIQMVLLKPIRIGLNRVIEKKNCSNNMNIGDNRAVLFAIISSAIVYSIRSFERQSCLEFTSAIVYIHITSVSLPYHIRVISVLHRFHIYIYRIELVHKIKYKLVYS